LLFAETTKFDGRERRELEPWEIAQIAGRAGRFGFHERGLVGVLSGIGWADPEPEAVEAALVPHVPLPGGHMGYRIVDTARVRPRLEDLDIEAAWELGPALEAWHRVASRQWALEGWIAVEAIGPLLTRLEAVERALKEKGRSLSLAETWSLVTAPVDEDNLELLGTLALALAHDRAQRPVLEWMLDVRNVQHARLEEAEAAARAASVLRWFALQYQGVGGVTIERAAALEEAAAARVTRLLREEVASPSVGRCAKCGQPAAPWFALCDRCYSLTSRRRTR
jgi:ATP-dependent RNA helicase SUPV3L1/SUV3